MLYCFHFILKIGKVALVSGFIAARDSASTMWDCVE